MRVFRLRAYPLYRVGPIGVRLPERKAEAEAGA